MAQRDVTSDESDLVDAYRLVATKRQLLAQALADREAAERAVVLAQDAHEAAKGRLRRLTRS